MNGLTQLTADIGLEMRWQYLLLQQDFIVLFGQAILALNLVQVSNVEFYYDTQGKKQSSLICSFNSLLIRKTCYICRRQVLSAFKILRGEIGKEGFRTCCTSEASKYGWLFKKARLPIGNYIVHSRAKFSVSERERRVTPGRIIESLRGVCNSES